MYKFKANEPTTLHEFSPAIICKNIDTLTCSRIPKANSPVITAGCNKTAVWWKSKHRERNVHLTYIFFGIFYKKHPGFTKPLNNKITHKLSYLAQRTQFVCRLREKRNFLLSTPHTFTVLSSEAVTSRWPSLEKWTLRTLAVWALNTVDSPFLWSKKQK